MGSLRSFIAVRLLMFFPIVWFMVSLVFVLLRVLPGGNPIKALYPQMPQEQVDAITADLGLDDPLHIQYFNYLRDIIRFDFGESIVSGELVMNEIITRFGHTVTLTIFALIIGIPLGIYLGGFSGAKRETSTDQSIRLFTIAFYATPIFLVGIIFQLIFAYALNILPANGVITGGSTGEFESITHLWIIDTLIAGRPDILWDYIKHMILPSLALGILIATSIARQVRTHMISQLEEDYVQFARSRGIEENKVVYSYTLKNAFLPVINLIGLQFALLLSGAILTETVFNISGLGRYIFSSITENDFPAIQGTIIIFVIIVNVTSLISDVIYGILDPRVKF